MHIRIESIFEKVTCSDRAHIQKGNPFGLHVYSNGNVFVQYTYSTLLAFTVQVWPAGPVHHLLL